jgi:hypothetical protein
MATAAAITKHHQAASHTIRAREITRHVTQARCKWPVVHRNISAYVGYIIKVLFAANVLHTKVTNSQE